MIEFNRRETMAKESVVSDEEIEKESWNRYGEKNGGQFHADRPYNRKCFINGAKWMRNKLTTKEEWISVDDRLPKEGKYVYVKQDGLDRQYEAVLKGNSFEIHFRYNGICLLTKPTHWKPLTTKED